MAGEEDNGQNGFIIDSARLSTDGTTEEDDEEEGNQGVAKSFSSHSKEVEMILKSAKVVQAIAVDLSKKGLVKIPEELYGMDHVEFLYLEGNLLQKIPSQLFEDVMNVKWLDLRNNNIHHLPAEIGYHRCLKTLLLEGNQISELPPEMGQLRTLTGLNLRGNPIEFPPLKVIEKGVKEILRYLREAMAIRSRRLQSAELRIEDLNLSDAASHSSGSENEYNPKTRLDPTDRLNHIQSSSRLSVRSSMSNMSDLEFPRPKSVSLHKHMAYEEYRQLQHQKFKRAGALGVLGKDNMRQVSSGRRRKRKQKMKKNRSPPIDPVQTKMAEERRLAKLAQLKQKQLVMEQKRKDTQLLEDWRQETRDMQRKHYIRAVKNAQQGFVVDPDLKMPYDTHPNFMKMMNREDMIKVEVKNKHEAMKNMITPEEQRRLDVTKMERDRQLISKIKEHTQKVQERKSRPGGNPQMEKDMAQKDLVEGQRLQQALHHRKDDLEYRFKAFTGDNVPSMSVTSTSGYRPQAK
ncbi:leucine-rich repeat-containing protein 27 [Strongylocentrotus purpuratus]|uniref:Leucine-rich repeat-containing protein 27 n=1 Tax=Strongylocentrotus purpuratus TaxID=7668 RepID=A0A7M7P0B8_STRPU|nr:leucine-rich repeat-containing protein 27 [Strongylocentrotus purpuratus]